ncbi:alpha/beta hydrolase-fold protein [Rhodococcus gannanensis]|uniref:alpha/beta hydrolase-fold protein n=1 Tax=Rhodococcus gannanensis TaxID=1960308 RepID=UPI00366C3104
MLSNDRAPRVQSTSITTRRKGALAAAALAAAIGVSAVATGQAHAVAPTTVRDGCAYVDGNERAQNIQTCWVWSESMQTSITVKIRPSGNQAGGSEQAVYFLGSLSDPSTNGRGDLYGTGYNLVAIPDSANGWSSNWQSPAVDSNGNSLGTPQWETFVGEELPLYLNDRFDIGTSGNAVSGLSISGGQAVNLALKYPDVFSVAVSRSGYYQTDSLLGYLLVPFTLSNRYGVSNGFDALWGNPFLPGNQWAENDIVRRIADAKANGQTIIISTGNGLVSSKAEWDEMIAQGGIAHVAIGSVLEIVSFTSTVLLNAQAKIFDLPIEFIYTNGAHTWNRWIRTDAQEAARLEEALGKYEQEQAAALPVDTESEATAEAAQAQSTAEPSTAAPTAAASTTSARPSPSAQVTETETEVAPDPTPTSEIAVADSTAETSTSPTTSATPTPTAQSTESDDTRHPTSTVEVIGVARSGR